ncbi:halocyanin domain-containing protein [Haloglomus salinum]|jgi:halocyanin-like protein|uniref:halocyanin domain-containing protein n=1 Tax=Haloglomus salinum TaxID=2962673 RepID=UPI0020C9F68D|nr:halocyanin domain-containing protein [Haloglomus salinum]
MSNGTSGRRSISRRAVLRGAVGATATATGASALAGPAAAQSQPSFGGWLSDVQNYNGVIDRTGRDEVTVRVGVDNGGQPYGFGPAAIQIDPGTTVVWEWTGRGNQHNVVDLDGAFESELAAEAGFTFEQTFEDEGVTKYYCQPHRALGMKGVVVTGDVELGGGGQPFEPPGGAFGLTFMGVLLGLSGLAGAAILGADGYRSYGAWKEKVTDVEGPAVESAPAEDSAERTIGHDAFDPTGTAALLIGYFIILVVLWILMYFVEFLGGGPTIIG